MRGESHQHSPFSGSYLPKIVIVDRFPAADPPPSFPPWADLPGDVTANILQRLDAVEILESAQKVCSTWWRVTHEPSFWRVIDLKPSLWEDVGMDPYDKETIDMLCGNMYCRKAVDRGLGEIIEINLEHFGNDRLLNYISQRACHLRRLRLACCDDITSEGLSEALKNFPELEELHLFHVPGILPADIQKIGISCPMLQSFTFDDRESSFIEGYEYSLAVAKTMPNLRHIRLRFGSRMRSKGLKAIVDGCQHLESVDVRRCFCVDLTGDLGKTFSEKMKDLKRPFDSCSDCGWYDSLYVWNLSSDDDDDDNYSIGDYDD